MKSDSNVLTNGCSLNAEKMKLAQCDRSLMHLPAHPSPQAKMFMSQAKRPVSEWGGGRKKKENSVLTKTENKR